MLSPAHMAVAPRRVPPAPTEPYQPFAGLLDHLGSVEHEEHVVIVGKDGPELMCALLRSGAPQVTHVCSPERLEAGSASLVIMPRVASLDWLAAALPAVRRALIANGRMALCVDPLPGTIDRARRLLAQYAFAAIRTSRVAGRQVLTAEVPSFGIRQSA